MTWPVRRADGTIHGSKEHKEHLRVHLEPPWPKRPWTPEQEDAFRQWMMKKAVERAIEDPQYHGWHGELMVTTQIGHVSLPHPVVEMYEDDDFGPIITHFYSPEELDAFIAQLQKVKALAWPEKHESSPDKEATGQDKEKETIC